MILSDRDILAEIASGRIKIDPFDESLINPASLDYRLGTDFYEVRATPGGLNPENKVIDPRNPHSFCLTDLKYRLEQDGSFILGPGEFIIANSMETISLPDDISIYGIGKSSLGRLGLQNSCPFAGFADPGFSGVMVLEISNSSANYIKLTPGMKIGQWIFMKQVSPSNKDYSKTGRYQNQGPGQGSKGI